MKFGKYDDGLLVRLEPPYYSGNYPYDQGAIYHILIAPHYQGDTLFPVNEWPLHVYMYLPLMPDPERRGSMGINELEKVAFGIIFRDTDKIRTSVRVTRPD